MAMLAEKKRREKWCLNPRGKQWSDDQSKFGQRLLEKMGWSVGQGLGVNKQGPTDIINVKKKDDNKGLGFKENGEEWTKTTSDYNELLDQLANTEGSENDQTNVTTSLEDRSKKSKARVHYHKFTRGKDLSRYSEKDLASIIGPDVVKAKYDSDSQADYNQNQINKGSSTDYFNSKKDAKKSHKPELNSNEEIQNDGSIEEETTSSFMKKHKKRKKSCKNDIQLTEEPNCEIEVTSKKPKCIEEVDYKFQENIDLSKKKQRKEEKKNKNLQNVIENESEVQFKKKEASSQSEEENNNLSFDSKNQEATKLKKKTKKYLDSIEHEEINNIGKLSEQQIEETTYKLSKNKKKSKPNCDSDSIVNKKMDFEKTSSKLNYTQLEEEVSKTVEVTNNEKVIKKKKKLKEIKSEIFLEIDNSIEKTVEPHENDLNLKLSKTKKSRATNNYEIPADCVVEEKNENNCDNTIKSEDEVISKKRKKIKQPSAQDQQSTDQLTVSENKPEKRKKSRKTAENSEDFVEDLVNYEIKRRKVNKENNKEDCVTINNEFNNSTLNSKLNCASPKSKDHHMKHSKPGKKSKLKSSQLEVEESDGSDGEEPKKENIVIKNKESKHKNQMTTLNDNEGCPSKDPNAFLVAFGRQTRLRNLNKHHDEVKPDNYETEEFMSLNENVNISFTENTECDNKWSNEIIENLLPKIYVDPNNCDCKTPASVANYEYRLLTQKVTELNIPSVDVKIIIKGSTLISKKLRKTLKLLYKSKYLKTILPQDLLVDIESAVEKFAAQLQPKINVINELLKLEDETGKLASEMQESSNILVDSRKSDNDELKCSKTSNVKKETLKDLKKQLKLLSKVKDKTVSSVLENEGVAGTKMTSSPAKYNNVIKGKEDRSKKPVQDESGHTSNSLQVRIDEKIKVLTDQINLLTKSEKIPTERITDTDNEDSLVKPKLAHNRPFVRGRGSSNHTRERLYNEKSYGDISNEQNWINEDYEDDKTNYSRANRKSINSFCNEFERKTDQYTKFPQQIDSSGEQATFRGQMRGGGRGSWGMGYGQGQAAYRGQMRGGGRGNWGMGYGQEQAAYRGQMRGGGRENWGVGYGQGQAAYRGQMKRGGRGSWGMGYGQGQAGYRGRGGVGGNWGVGYGHGQGAYTGQMRGRGRGMSFGFHQGPFRGQTRGRGRIVVRGRVSKNNYDAKQYAEKCKSMNIMPEIVFKGVDLQVISGYAADKKEATIESSSHKKEH